MNFNTYQEKARETALYPDVGSNLWYPTLGLAGEAGEVAEKVKKIYRDQGGLVTEQDKIKIRKELGDVLWYIANIAAELEMSLSEVAIANISKLADRAHQGTIHGSGDNR